MNRKWCHWNEWSHVAGMITEKNHFWIFCENSDIFIIVFLYGVQTSVDTGNGVKPLLVFLSGVQTFVDTGNCVAFIRVFLSGKQIILMIN